jgi:uncharacterized protein (TIGR04222 family)
VAEELGFLAAGPRRAAEVAVVRLLDAGLLRVSRDGAVSPVHTRPWPVSLPPVTAAALTVVRSGTRSLGSVVQTIAASPEALAMRGDLERRGLLASRARRRTVSVLSALPIVLVVVLFVTPIGFWWPLGAAAAALVLRAATRTARAPLRSAGREAIGRAWSSVPATDHPVLVALHGIGGRIGRHRFGQPVAKELGLSAEAVAGLGNGKARRRKKNRRSSAGCGSGCGTASSCGGGCGSSGSGCGSSGGSSCGGGGCGGGGGGD